MRFANHFRGLVLVAAALVAGTASADEFETTIERFRNAVTTDFFNNTYGYAVFPTVGKGAIGIGGAHGKGQVYARGVHVGNTAMTQLSIGFALGGQVYSQIVFFEDQRAFNEFTGGNFEFGAQATAVAITAGAGADAGTTGASTTVSGGSNNARVAGNYYKGMAVFTIAKGGLMYEASIAGQKFQYTPLGAEGADEVTEATDDAETESEVRVYAEEQVQ